MFTAHVYKVFLASPSDVATERKIAREVINKWNDLHSEKTGIILQAIGWESHSYPAMGDRAQGILNKQILQDADFLIGMFWTRIGTPTGNHESGTLEEIREHINKGKPAMICFSEQPVQMGSVDPEQYQKLMVFKQECFDKGLVSPYETLDAFTSIINDALVFRANRQDPFVGFQKEEPVFVDLFGGYPEPVRVELSEDAQELLIEASNDSNGTILRVEYLSGSTMQTNGKQLLIDGSAREVARWDAALNCIKDNGFVEPVGTKGQIFKVTHSGYEYADILKMSKNI
ncbi:DUF4062 domain-containing protein [Vibrio alginolyticus]|uniref:DUF4062 domain-containing protein n=1 Tax=Vibrio alginolyticus TaxID=663 RepID=UPI00215E580D|nr:DUF4062 domain-containing protein [Vibrio alginolyticus]EGR2354505.1 DUF4062 domain-containing protein [Vibrio alginolyticus]EJV5950641.1 DUF4062 domain-containing protein [Vibrio alginolyticus]ELB2764240.1 DUF4062 domain-containing protein [Vibrio alginolyticus]MCS0283347.1 DUF4062 domain-containing protein [Vibrio alginolyticus]